MPRGDGASGGARAAGIQPGSWRDEARDFVRAFSGAFGFAVPLLSTMERWWIGQTAGPWQLLAFLAVAFAIGLVLSRPRTAGFKSRTDLLGAVAQAVAGVAVGPVGAVVVLAALNRIRPGGPPGGGVGQVVAQGVPPAIGVSVANAVFA